MCENERLGVLGEITGCAPDYVLLCGGSGGSRAAKGFVEALPHSDTVAVVSTSDDGGSSGKLKLYTPEGTGDLRRVIGAVGESEYVEELLNTRFASNRLLTLGRALESFAVTVDLSGVPDGDRKLGFIIDTTFRLGLEMTHDLEDGIRAHTLGNVMLAAMAAEYGIMSSVQTLSDVVKARARVLPAIVGPQELIMRDGDTVKRGEHKIDTELVKHPFDALVYFDDEVRPSTFASRAIRDARAIVASPGSPFTSIGPHYAAFAKEIQGQGEVGGLFLSVVNLFNTDQDTAGWHSGDYARMALRHTGRPFDAMLLNDNFAGLPKSVRGKAVLLHSATEGTTHPRVITGDFVGETIAPDVYSPIARSPLAHNTHAIAKTVESVMDQVLHHKAAHLARVPS